MTFAEIEERLRAEILDAREDGWKIRPGCLGYADRKTCCAIGAVVRDLIDDSPGLSKYPVAAGRLGIRVDDLNDIALGFDGGKYGGPSTQFGLLGARIREFSESLP